MVKDKVLFNSYIAQRVAEKLRGAAKAEGKTYSDWLEETIMLRVRAIETKTGKPIRGVKKRVVRRRAAA